MRTKRTSPRHLTAMLLLTASLSAPPLLAAEGGRKVSIEAGPAPMAQILTPIETEFEASTGTDLVLTKKLPGDGFVVDLDSGQADGVITGLDLAHWLSVLKGSGRHLAQPASSYKERVVGRNLFWVITEPSVGVKALSRQQLSQIFTGSSLNWKELGGKDLPIHIVMTQATPGINFAFQRLVMRDKDFGGDIERVESFSDVVARVAELEGAIGYCPRSFWKEGAAVVKTPTLGRPYYLITRGRPSPEVEELVTFVKRKGDSL